MSEWSESELSYMLQFQHPEKALARLPGVSDETIAPLFGVSPEAFRQQRRQFADEARRAAETLLADPAIRDLAAKLPLAPGQTVVALGDSITDDAQSWFEIMRHWLDLAHPGHGVRLVNLGISGDCSTQMLARFLGVLLAEPDWILCMVGANDCRRHGVEPTEVLVSPEETARNLRRLRAAAAAQTQARWLWLTPTPVIEGRMQGHWSLGTMQLDWRNEDLLRVVQLMRAQPDPVVDLWSAFGLPTDPALLLDDGLHPSLAGQQRIARAVLETLAALG